MEYGLTDKGFIAKSFEVLLEEERDLFRQSFGTDIDLSNDTPEGAYVANQAIKKTQLWEMAEGIWLAGDSDAASGVYLDRLVSLVNVERRPAAATQVYAALWGEEGTAVQKGHLSRMSTGERFSLNTPVTIGRGKLLGFSFKISKVQAGIYSFSLDGLIISVTAVAGDDEEAIQQKIFDQMEAVFPGVYAAENSGSDGMLIHSSIGIAPFYLFCDDQKIEILSLGAFGLYSAVIPGPTFVSAGQLNEIVSNVSGLDSVINYAAGITGRDAESDAELRIEKNRRQRQASGNEIAIENAVKEAAGVLYARVYSNRSGEEIDGRPPKSYETVVMGGIDQEIAQVIFEKGPAGVQAFGNTMIEVTDSEGFTHEIGLSRPEPKYIWLKIAYSKNPEESFPANGVELLKDNIDNWGASNQDVGIDFIYQKLNRPVYDVPGIDFADIKAAVTDDLTPPSSGAYAAQNVVINERQIALIDKTRIDIQELLE
jgi:uncharacterized phage protein gp47/JayE